MLQGSGVMPEEIGLRYTQQKVWRYSRLHFEAANSVVEIQTLALSLSFASRQLRQSCCSSLCDHGTVNRA